jgi:uncharacterized protein YndB with AHSA1/START domain
MKSPGLKLFCSLKADPKRVFGALTDSKLISAWSGQKGKVEARVGGKFEMFDGWVKGKVLAYQEGKSLAYTWHTADWSEGEKPSVVSYTLKRAGAGTRVSLTHTGFPNVEQMKEHKAGWKEHVFDPLKEFFASA